MNQLELLRDMAKAGFTFGKNEQVGTYLKHEAVYEAIEKITSVVWGIELPYYFNENSLVFDLGDSTYTVEFEDDELDVDRLLNAAFHVYTWI